MYRLYVDETGNSDLKASNDPNHRYLSLSGIFMDVAVSGRAAFTKLEALKARFFDSHPDDPVILHRKDVMTKKHPFEALRDPLVEAAFNATLLDFFTRSNFSVITAVIDKREHLARYGIWHHDPYHYCLEVLIERYVLELRQRGSTGDVMAEVRGGKPDRRLEKSFARLYENGSSHVRRDVMQRHLSTKKLKLRRKEANVTGLQMADMIAHPSAMYVRSIYGGDPPPDRFGGEIVKLLVDWKYRRNAWTGKLEGYGIKWLP